MLDYQIENADMNPLYIRSKTIHLLQLSDRKLNIDVFLSIHMNKPNLKANYLKSDYTFSNVNVPTLNIGFHDPVHTCIKPQNAYNITFETLYNQINAKALEYNYMSNNKIRFWIQEKSQGGKRHFLNNCNKHFASKMLFS